MSTEIETAQAPRTLLGLTPPRLDAAAFAERAEGTMPLPGRPAYPMLSSGHDSEDAEERGQSSDTMAALRAGGMLVMVLLGFAYLLS